MSTLQSAIRLTVLYSVLVWLDELMETDALITALTGDEKAEIEPSPRPLGVPRGELPIVGDRFRVLCLRACSSMSVCDASPPVAPTRSPAVREHEW